MAHVLNIDDITFTRWGNIFTGNMLGIQLKNVHVFQLKYFKYLLVILAIYV